MLRTRLEAALGGFEDKRPRPAHRRAAREGSSPVAVKTAVVRSAIPGGGVLHVVWGSARLLRAMKIGDSTRALSARASANPGSEILPAEAHERRDEINADRLRRG